MEIQIIIKFISLVISIWFGTVVLGNGLQGRFVSWVTLLIMSVSIALFIFLQWNLF